MRQITAVTGAMVLMLMAWPSLTLGWWDTQTRAQKPEPLVAEYQATAHAPADADVRDDEQADGGQGGQVVHLKPGQGLTLSADMPRGVYSIWVIARADEADFNPPQGDAKQQAVDLPGGEITMEWARQPIYTFLEVEGPNGERERWYMPITYREDYAIVSKLYFPVHIEGEHTVRVGFDERSEIGLLVDRVELRDVLGLTARQGAKTQRMLTSDQELRERRARFAQTGQIEGWKNTPRNLQPRERIDMPNRLARNDALWSILPDWNTIEADPTHGFRHGAWDQVAGGERSRGEAGHGIAGYADIYEATGCVESAWDASVMLAAFAEKYPGLDFFYIAVGGQGSGQNVPGNFRQDFPFKWGSWYGKWEYSGWAPRRLEAVVIAYDKLFDFIDGNQQLADYVGTKIPWVKTPDDVIELIDTNILQHGMDALNRRILRNDMVSVLIPLVQGVNEVSHEMLASGAFSRVHYNMADAGGLDDQAFTSFSRGGVHYIGATGYVNNALSEVADYLRKYREAGGDARFDLSDPQRYPQMAEAQRTVERLRAAGGFPIIIGDSMDLRRGREANIAEHPSRVVEGFGAVVLEDGQGEANPRLKRAVAIRTGIGRGHSHQDALNLELFAHGARLAPDLGGRHEGSNRSRPNMRLSRMHNLAEVDERNFHNPYPGSTTGATGWTTSFSPQPGAQYTANAARGTSHPDVRLYQRSTAMIDGPASDENAPVYLFDVFRVHGGSVHTYAFHGAITADGKIDTNFPLEPASSEEALAYMDNRPEDSRLEGEAPPVMQATWMLEADLQQRYQSEVHQPDKPVGITLTLFGREGEHVMVGSAVSEVYPVEMPYLHVQRRDPQEGLVSVYPALYEAHAGGRFLGEKKLLNVTPNDGSAERGVAVSVRVGDDRRDVLFNSLKPETVHELEDGTRVAGEFGFISEDAEGLRMLHLVGGTELSRDGVRVRTERAAYQATITAVDFPNHKLTLSESMPARLLDGQVALLGNEQHWSEFELGKVNGTSATVVRTPRYYQSRIEGVDEAAGTITTELEPMVFGADTQHTEGTTIANEAHDTFWKAHVEAAERWIYLGWPGTRLSSPDHITMDDVPDANGDGRQTIKLMSVRADQPSEEASTVLIELEVTRVDVEENLVYFKMPTDEEYQQGGWQFAWRDLVNEDASKRWMSTYPGTSFAWKVEQAQVSREQLLVPGTDQLGKLYAYHFGPGDAFRVQSFVHLSRVRPGLYELRANVPCELTLPGAGDVAISHDGQRFDSIEAAAADGSVKINLTADQLGDGHVWLRIGK